MAGKTIHPLVRVLLLLMLAGFVQFASPLGLALAGGGLFLAAALRFPRLLGNMLHRSRWLLLTLLLIFAFTTPGEFLRQWPFDIAPTYEGLASGLLQASRIAVMLAGLALLIGSTHRQALMVGLFMLLSPLRWLGLPPERFTARLWLTLHYVEQAPALQRGTIWAVLGGIAAGEPAPGRESISIEIPVFTWQDAMVMLMTVAVIGLLL